MGGRWKVRRGEGVEGRRVGESVRWAQAHTKKSPDLAKIGTGEEQLYFY